MNLQLNDILEIGTNNYFRIDNYTLNLLTQDVSLNLVKSFDTNIGGFYPSTGFVIADYLEQTKTITVNGLTTSMTVLEVDTGDGTTWASYEVIGVNIVFTFLQNNTGLTRTMDVEVTNDSTLQEFTVILIQTATTVSFDNNVITFDNNLITFDNG